MAKKIKEAGELTSVFDLVKSVDKGVEIISEACGSNISEWISTGNYILNACMSGDIYKGIPAGRIVTFAGTSGAGKSYLACSCAREAQKVGYTVIVLDSEGAYDSKFVERLGVDSSKLLIKQVSTIFETSQFIANMCKALQQQEDEQGAHQKVMFILDSLGNLTSDKEREDTMAGNQKRDMTKAQEIKAMFRVNATPLAKLQCPLIVVNHVYASVGSYVPTNIQSGGSGIVYNSSLTIELSASKLVDKNNDKAAEKTIGASNATKNGVLVTAKPTKSRFCIPHKVQFQIPWFCRPNPFVGLHDYITWENAGIMKGNIITQKEYDKLTDAAKAKIAIFEHDGETMYAEPKETARGYVIKHLGQTVPLTELFTDKVFTPEFLDNLNNNVIHPLFDLPDQNSFDDIKDLEDSVELGESIETNDPTEDE